MCQLELFTLYQHLLLFSFQRAVKEYVMTVDATYGKQFDEFFVGFEGSLDPNTSLHDLSLLDSWETLFA